MVFYDWMIEKYSGKDTPRGDLAFDMQHEGDLPMVGDRERILDYLFCKRACAECVALFKRCWRDYEKCEKVLLKRSCR